MLDFKYVLKSNLIQFLQKNEIFYTVWVLQQ